ncbi:MAG: TatD family hydrolase [Thermomicrobiales bacterium]|nr:TatD family hydrolase [Thermomicrobiales bacterium]
MSAHPGPAPIVDTHAHLDDSAFDADRDGVLAASREAGVARVINIGYNPASWERSRQLRERFPDQIEIVLGLHPLDAMEFRPALTIALQRAIETMRPVAIGEAGFDFSRRMPALADQERAFQAQIELAAAFGLPLVIHQRAAGDDLMLALDRAPDLAPIVLHSFDGNQRLMDWAIERGCYFGVGGLALKPGSTDLRALLRQAPRDRLLLETDSPYLAPPAAPSRRNTPANLPAMAAALAPIWSLDAEAVCRLTTRNASRLFGLGLAVAGAAMAADDGEGGLNQG